MLPAARRLSIAHVRAGERRVLVVAGEIGLETAPLLSLAFSRAAEAAEPVGVDLSGAEVADDCGMALLINALRRLHRCRGDVIVVCPPGRVRIALGRAGVARRMTLLDEPHGLAGSPLEAPAASLGPTIIAGPRARRSTPTRRGRLLVEATLAIEERYADATLALPDVARAIATSERQLQRVFAELGTSAFRDELAAVRMQHAASMLQETDLPISEIARRVGYRQAAQFAKAFRRHNGPSPSAFRRAARADSDPVTAARPDPRRPAYRFTASVPGAR